MTTLPVHDRLVNQHRTAIHQDTCHASGVPVRASVGTDLVFEIVAFVINQPNIFLGQRILVLAAAAKVRSASQALLHGGVANISFAYSMYSLCLKIYGFSIILTVF